jgi:aminotransferase EvaB
LVEDRDALLAFLEARGVEAKVHYPIPLNKQVAAKRDCILSSTLTNVDRHAERLITLPVHQYLQTEQLSYTVSSLSEFYFGAR